MSKNKKYEIETLEQLINITTTENFERLSVDFPLTVAALCCGD